MAAATKRASSAIGSRRQENARAPWTQAAPPVDFGREQFRFTLLRTARKLPALDIDPFVEHADWQRADSQRTGELNFRRPLTQRAADQVANGDVVRCEVDALSSGQWRRLWQMTVQTPSEDIAAGSLSLALASQLDPVTKNRAAFKFRKDHAHPRGWKADQITRAVAKRFHIKLGRVAVAHHYMTRLVETSAGPLDVIVRAWQHERTQTGRRYDVDTSRGILEVLELRRPKYMLLIGAAIADATVEHRIDGIASAIVATATRHEAGKRTKRKLHVKVIDAARVRRYGYIVKTVSAPAGIDTVAELRRYAKRRLARLHAPRPTVTFTHPGLAWIDRGDAILLQLPEAGLVQLVFVTEARHNLSAGSYTMDVTVAWTDPWAADARAARVAKKKTAAARKRNRTTSATSTPPVPKKAATRLTAGEQLAAKAAA